MPTTSERFGLAVPGTSDPFVTADIAANWEELDQRSVKYRQGTIANRPAASAANRGLVYEAVDQDGLLYWCTGSAWLILGDIEQGELEIVTYLERRVNIGNVSGAVNLSLIQNQHWRLNPTAAITITFANLPSAGWERPGSIVVDNSNHTVTWGANVVHPNGVPPALNGETWLTFVAQSARVIVGGSWTGVA